MDKIRPSADDVFEKSIILQPSMDKFQFEEENQVQLQSNKENIIMSSTLVSNGSTDFKGRVADKRKTGGWKGSPFLIVNEVAERMAFFAIAVNMVAYMVFEMHQTLPTAITHVTNWIGAAYVLTIFGAFIADAYWGRFKTIVVFSCIYAAGMIMLTLSAGLDSMRPPKCTVRPCIKATDRQNNFLYGALALIALGTGGIKPCVSSFGADQFDEADQKEAQKKYAFFNWFFFAINMGALFGITVVVYIEDRKGWVWGFGVPTVLMLMSILFLIAGVGFYRFQKPMGSPFTRFFQVIVASLRNHFSGVASGRLYEVGTVESDIVGARKLAHTTQYRFLDKAAIITDAEANPKNRWKLCTITQVEELKCFIRVLPIWASTIALALSFAQQSTFFVSQANRMDRKIGTFTIPAGSTPVFAAINGILLVPLYELWVVPFIRKFTGHRRGLTSLQRMGVGLFVSIFSLAAAAMVEKKRRDHSNSLNMTVFWLFPQFFLMGTAEVFTYVGQLEFFYDQATDGTRSISSAFFLSEIGIGSWISTALVKIIEKSTGGEEKGWLRNDINKSRVDYFYWILAGINGVNFLVYVLVAWRFKGKGGGGDSNSVRDETMIEIEVTKKKKKENDDDDDDKGDFKSVML